MGLALGTLGVVLLALVWELERPAAVRSLARARLAWHRRRIANEAGCDDPGRERRAEQRARELLRSCVAERDWEMYRDLGLLRVAGSADGPLASAPEAAGDELGQGPPYAYLIYPHSPIVAFVPASGELLGEYCIAFPDETMPYGSPRLPDSDDVLAKWMVLTGDERQLIAEANMHLPGRQVDRERVRRDLTRIARWERERRVLSRPGPVREDTTPARPGNVAAA